MQTSLMRTRWAAIGAAVAVTLGFGGIHFAGATISSGERTSYVAINPCRLADTRPGEDNVGARSIPLGPNTTFVLAGTGDQGNCHSAVPATATALSLNVTAINQTQGTYLTVYPTGSTQPTTSNLNPSPGQPPTPNAVTVKMNAGGEFSIFNKNGSVDVIVDVVGFYESHDHDDRYYTEAETDARIATAITTPGHITGNQVLDGSLSLSDLTGTGIFREYLVVPFGAPFSVDAHGCMIEDVSIGVENAFRMLVPMRIGAGNPGAAALSSYPVVLSTSGLASILICNSGNSTFTPIDDVYLDYYLI